MGSRINKLASILVDYSVNIQPGDRVMVEASRLPNSWCVAFTGIYWSGAGIRTFY